MLRPRFILVLLLLPALFPFFAGAQGPIAPPSAPAESARADQNSFDGLRLRLQDLLNAAKDRDVPKLKSLIKQMEIPNYKDWFAKNYGEEKAERLAGAYERNLGNSESDLETLFTQLAGEVGEFTLRKASDAQASGQILGGNAPAMRGQQDPADPFFASWNNGGSSAPIRVRPLGSFVYVDGSFRLLRTFRIMATRPMMGSGAPAPRGTWSTTTGPAPNDVPGSGPTNGPVQAGVRIASLPSCDYCPAAEYSAAARKKHLEGTVVLQTIVQPDGSATDMQVVKSSDPELTQMAMDGVSRWRFKPARDEDGEPVPYRVAIDVSFRLAK
jgi:TonB family protein